VRRARASTRAQGVQRGPARVGLATYVRVHEERHGPPTYRVVFPVRGRAGRVDLCFPVWRFVACSAPTRVPAREGRRAGGAPWGRTLAIPGAVNSAPEIAAVFGGQVEYFDNFGGNPVSAAAALAVLDVIDGSLRAMRRP